MAMVWNSKDKHCDLNSENTRDSFKEHDARMRRFYLVHPRIEPKESQDATHAPMGTTLVPIWRVTTLRFWLN